MRHDAILCNARRSLSEDRKMPNFLFLAIFASRMTLLAVTSGCDCQVRSFRISLKTLIHMAQLAFRDHVEAHLTGGLRISLQFSVTCVT